jgi:hypothetical protein
MLSLSDNLTVSLAIFQLVFSFVVSLTLWRLTAWQRRYEGLEDRLHDATTRLIDERFRAMTHEVNSHVQKFLLTVEEMKQRIQLGDGEIRGLCDRDQKLELLLSARLDHLKDYIRDTAATRKDLEKHESSVERKLAQVELRLGDLTSTVAVLTERVKE